MPGKTALCKDGSPLVSGEVLSCIKDASVLSVAKLAEGVAKKYEKVAKQLKKLR